MKRKKKKKEGAKIKKERKGKRKVLFEMEISYLKKISSEILNYRLLCLLSRRKVACLVGLVDLLLFIHVMTF